MNPYIDKHTGSNTIEYSIHKLSEKEIHILMRSLINYAKDANLEDRNNIIKLEQSLFNSLKDA